MPVPLGLWIVGASLGLFSLALARDAGSFSLAEGWDGGAALLAVGWSLMACGLVHRSGRDDNRIGLLLFGAGLAWFLSEWDSPFVGSDAAFSTGLLMYAAWPAFVVHAVVAYPTGRLDSRIERVVVAAGYGITVGAVGLVPTLFYDPRSRGCTRCPDNLWLLADRPDLLLHAGQIGIGLALTWALAALVLMCGRLTRWTAARLLATGWVAGAGAAVLGSLVVSYGVNVRHGFLGTAAVDQLVWKGQVLALAGLAVAVASGMVRSRLRRRALARLIVDLGPAGRTGGVREALATRLGDPGLQLAYPTGRTGYVDASARPITLPIDGRTATPIRVAGEELALLLHRPGLADHPELAEEISSATQLGLRNEALRAQALARLDELRASRARIVEAGDEERRRLERDLHDGAQQRLIALSLAVRLLQSRQPDKDSPLPMVEAEVRHSIEDLRDLARGLFPAVLRDEGLAAALEALAESHPLRVDADALDRFPDVIETTAYQAVAHVASMGRASATARGTDDCLDLDIDVHSHEAVPGLRELEDRIGALGGRLAIAREASGRTRVHVVLPRG